MTLPQVTNGILDRIKETDYEGADLNQLRNDFVEAFKALRRELHAAVMTHVRIRHAGKE